MSNSENMSKVSTRKQGMLNLLRVIDVALMSLGQPDTLHKKRSFPLRISSVNMTKSAVSSRFGHIY